MARRRAAVGLAGPRFLTTRQSAARLGVSINALKAWIRDARLPALRTPGGHHRIAEADLLAFMARLTAPAGHPAPRVLLVDDDGDLLVLLRDALEEAWPAARIECATDGYQALLRVGAFRPDLLVLDLRMPRLDGFEVCRQLRARPETRGIRILAMTGFPGEGARDRILAGGADDFVEKPFRPADVCARIVALLRGGAGR